MLEVGCQCDSLSKSLHVIRAPVLLLLWVKVQKYLL